MPECTALASELLKSPSEPSREVPVVSTSLNLNFVFKILVTVANPIPRLDLIGIHIRKECPMMKQGTVIRIVYLVSVSNNILKNIVSCLPGFFKSFF